MCASAEASAAVSRALACSSSSTFVSVLMPQSCQVAAGRRDPCRPVFTSGRPPRTSRPHRLPSTSRRPCSPGCGTRCPTGGARSGRRALALTPPTGPDSPTTSRPARVPGSHATSSPRCSRSPAPDQRRPSRVRLTASTPSSARGEVATDGDALAGVPERQAEDTRGLVGGDASRSSRSTCGRGRASGRSAHDAAPPPCRTMASRPGGVEAVAAGREVGLARCCRACRCGAGTCHEGRRRRVAAMRNLPLTGSLTARPLRPPGAEGHALVEGAPARRCGRSRPTCAAVGRAGRSATPRRPRWPGPTPPWRRGPRRRGRAGPRRPGGLTSAQVAPAVGGAPDGAVAS